MSTGEHKKVDMSSDAIAAYHRKLKEPRTDLPSAPSLGIPRNSETATNVARLATKREPVKAMPRPTAGSDAARASILANSHPTNVPPMGAGSRNSLSSSAAARSLSMTSTASEQQKPNAGAAAAATHVIATSGEDTARKYLASGYQWSARDTNSNSGTIDIGKLQAAAEKRARERLSSVEIHNHREDPTSAAAHQYDVKNAITVYQLAEQRVRERLEDVDRKNADRSILGTSEQRRLAYELVSKQHAARSSINAGKRDLGGGLYMNDDEIMAIARRNVEPDLDTISRLVRDRHEADRIAAEEKAAAQQAKAEEKERHHKAKTEEKERKAEEKQRKAEQKADEKQRKAEEKALERDAKAIEKRQAKERENIDALARKARDAEAALAAIKAGENSTRSVEAAAKDAADAKQQLAEAKDELKQKEAAERESAAELEKAVTKHRDAKQKYHTLKDEETEQFNNHLHKKWRPEALERAIDHARKSHQAAKEKHERKQQLALAEYRIKASKGKLWPKQSAKKKPAEDYDEAKLAKEEHTEHSKHHLTNDEANELIKNDEIEQAKDIEAAADFEAAADKADAEEAEAKEAKKDSDEDDAASVSSEPEITPYKEFDESAVKVTEPEPTFTPSPELEQLKAQVKELKAQRIAAEQAHEAAKTDVANAQDKVDALTKEYESLVALESELRTREENRARQQQADAEREANARQEAVLKARLESTTLTDLEKAQAESEYADLKKRKLDAELEELERKAADAQKLASENEERRVKAQEAVAAAEAKHKEQEAAAKAAAEAADTKQKEEAKQRAKDAEESARDKELAEGRAMAQGLADGRADRAHDEAVANAKAEHLEEYVDAKDSVGKDKLVPVVVPTDSLSPAQKEAAAKARALETAAQKEAQETMDAEAQGIKDGRAARAHDDATAATKAKTIESEDDPKAGVYEEAATDAAAQGKKVQAYDQAATDAAAEGKNVQAYDQAAQDAASQGKNVQAYDQAAQDAAAEGDRVQLYDKVAEEAAAAGAHVQDYDNAAFAAAAAAKNRESLETVASVKQPLGQPDEKEAAALEAKADEIAQRSQDAHKDKFEGFESSADKPKHGIFSEQI